jgi:hypothetical protein
MGRGINLLFDSITVIFVFLTLVVGLVVLAVASGAMESPVFAPANTLPPATPIVLPTITPSTVPADLTATVEATMQPGS